MVETTQPTAAGAGGGDAGMPFYEKSRAKLKELLAKRRNLEKQLVSGLPRFAQMVVACEGAV